MGKKALFFLFLALISTLLLAGDFAIFANLGFSEDSKYFMFGQYGMDSETSYAYAEFYIVDVAKNDFVPGGVISKNYSIPVQPGDDGGGGLYTLLEQNYSIIKKYNINHLYTGRIVYVLFDGETPKSKLQFRDFNTGALYDVSLIQSASGEGKDVTSSFHLEVTVTFKDGDKKNFTIGRPTYKRKGVKEYRIKYIFVAPDGKSLVFVLEKDIIDSTGENIRYMVETQKVHN